MVKKLAKRAAEEMEENIDEASIMAMASGYSADGADVAMSDESDQSDVSDIEEEREGEGEGEEDDNEEDSHAQKRGKKNSSLYKLPTSDEVRQLKETQQLFKSNLFRMQIDELIKEVRIDFTKQRFIESSLHNLKEILDSLPSASREVELRTDSIKGVHIPLPPLVDQSVKFHFHAPASVALAGSYLLRTVTKPDLNVDVIVEMPKECFEHKDHINYRYHAKRACYLSVIAKALMKNPAFANIKFSMFQGDPSKPILTILPQDPEGKLKTKFVIRIIPSITADTFKLLRLWPDRNSVRGHHVYAILNSKPQNEEGDDTEDGPTPHYNNSVLEDTSFTFNLAYLHGHMVSCPALVESVLLFKVWLRQRGLPKGTEFSNGLAGFNGFLISMILCHLIDIRRINRQMSCYQMFRLTLDFIAHGDWTKTPVTMCKVKDDSTIPDPESFVGRFDVVFLDPSGRINLCARVSQSVYEELRHEAINSVKFLDDAHTDGFDVLFMQPVDFNSKCDHILHVEHVPGPEVLGDTDVIRVRGDYGAWADERMKEWVAALLRKAFSDRVKLVCVRQQPYDYEWSLNKPQPLVRPQGMTVGLLINVNEWNRLLDKGPDPSDIEAVNEYKQFWGPKASMRKFKDSSLHETVLWDRPRQQRHLVMLDIAKFVLRRHAGFVSGSEGVEYIAHQTQSIIEASVEAGRQVRQSEEEAQAYLLGVYQGLVKHLRNLRELPLRINSVQAISPALRGTEVFVPRKDGLLAQGHDLPPSLEAIESVLILEGSGKWPEDLATLQHTKTAFYLRIASLLEADWEKRMKQGLGESASQSSRYEALPMEVHAHMDHLDVIKGGLAFRFVITNEREGYLLRVNEQDVVAAIEHTTRFIRRPKHSVVINDVQHRHPSYSECVRLFKRWLCAHMFTGLIKDEAAEIIVASVYLHARPYQAPHSALVAFFRVMSLIAHHDWDNQALIVDLNDTLTPQDYSDIQHVIKESLHKNNRESLPSMFLATSLDKEIRDRINTGSLVAGQTGLLSPWVSPWSQHGSPTRTMLLRVVAFAKSSFKVLRQQFSPSVAFGSEEVDFKQVFLTPLNDYDALIHLRTDVLPNVNQQIGRPAKKQKKDKFRNLQEFKPPGDPVVNFNPVEKYVDLLKKNFSEHALFFYDRLGSNVIGVVWLPKTYSSYPFSISAASQTMPASVKVKLPGKKGTSPTGLVANLPSLLAQIKLCGEGLVDSVEVQ